MKNNRVQIEPFIDDKTEEYDYKILIYGNYTPFRALNFPLNLMSTVSEVNALDSAQICCERRLKGL